MRRERVDQRERAEADQQHGPERGGREVVGAALREQRGHREPADHRGRAERQRAAAAARASPHVRPRAWRRRRRRGRRPRPGSRTRWRARARRPRRSERRAHAQAPTASAMPSVNGIRPMTTLLITPPRKSQAASAPAAGVGARRRASTAKRPDGGHARHHADEPGARERGQRRVEQGVAGHVMARRTTARSTSRSPPRPRARSGTCAPPCRRSPAPRSGRRRR